MSANQHMGCLHCDKIFQELVEFPDLGGQQPDAEASVAASNTEPSESSATVIDKKKKRKK